VEELSREIEGRGTVSEIQQTPDETRLERQRERERERERVIV
jgi:hypothetical protein